MNLLATAVVDWLAGFIGEFLWPLIQFLIGLGLVVFVHELGHFLAARWAGIKVERFALGMGPRVLGFRRGDTDYCFCAIPIGGYVKMLGQEDFKAAKEGDTMDPRSFNAARVGKRLVVISAGVVMNVVLAAVLFVIICLVGMDFEAPVIGGAKPTYPAAKAEIDWRSDSPVESIAPRPEKTGLKPGDRILTINGKAVSRFADLGLAAALATKDEKFDVTLQRDVHGQSWTGRTTLAVRFNEEFGAPQFGLYSAMDMVVGRDRDFITAGTFQGGDRIVAIDGRKIEHHWQLADITNRLESKKCEITVERKDKDTAQVRTVKIPQRPAVRTRGDLYYRTDGKRIDGWLVVDRQDPKADDAELKDKHGKTIKVRKDQLAFRTDDGEVLLVSRDEVAGGGYLTMLDVLGMTPRLKVGSIEKGSIFRPSPAVAAGLEPGDVILSYADRPLPTFREFFRISQDVGESETTITVLRDGKILTKKILPRKKQGEIKIGAILGLDLSHPVVAAVRLGSPAAAVGVERDAEIIAVNDEKIHCWADLITALKKLRGRELALLCRIGTVEKTFALSQDAAGQFRADDYKWSLLGDVPFKPLTVTIKHNNPLKAVAWGANETVRMIVSTYQSLVAIIRGSVSASKQARGPVGIGALAIRSARQGLVHLAYLMAFLSTVLAVFNFLPIPVLDGGHAMLIVVEKVRGRPLPLKLVNALQMIFLVLILGLLALVTVNDLLRLGG